MPPVKSAFTHHAPNLETMDNGIRKWILVLDNCKADCGICSGAVLTDHKAVQYDSCEMWVHNGYYFITESQYETLQKTNYTWICPKCEFVNFSDSFFDDQLNLENQNRFDPQTKEKKTGSSPLKKIIGTSRNNFIGGLKFVSINIKSIRGKKL